MRKAMKQIINDETLKFLPALTMGMGAFLATFDVTAVSLILPSISESYLLDVAESIWVMNAYSLAFTIFLIVAGALADRYSNKFSLAFGGFLFLFSSVLCAFAPIYEALVFGRLLQGIGAAFIVCGGYALMGELYTERADRVQAFAIMGTVGGSALAVGPGLGGVISSTLGWTWIFLINVPVCIAIIIGALNVIEAPSFKHKSNFDFAGVTAFSLFLLSSSWFLLYGARIFGYDIGFLGGALVVAALFLLFVLVETRVSAPAIDLSLFKKPTFVGLALVPLCLAVSYWSLIVYIPLFFESVFHIDIEHVSYILLFFTLPMFCIPYVTKNIAIKLSDRKFYSFGLFIVALGCFCISIGAHAKGYGMSMLGMVVAGCGAAAMQAQVSGALIASASKDQAGAVSAILTALRQGGFAIGIALLAVVLKWQGAFSETVSGNFTIMFFVCGVIASGGAVAILMLLIDGDSAAKQ